MVVGPVYVLVPVSVCVPAPDFTRDICPLASETTPANVPLAPPLPIVKIPPAPAAGTPDTVPLPVNAPKVGFANALHTANVAPLLTFSVDVVFAPKSCTTFWSMVTVPVKFDRVAGEIRRLTPEPRYEAVPVPMNSLLKWL